MCKVVDIGNRDANCYCEIYGVDGTVEKRKKQGKTGQKVRLLHLIDIFKKKTDEKHALTANKLIDELRVRGCEVERRCIAEDIAALNSLNEEIVLDPIIESAGRNTGYYLARREFRLSEVKLLVDVVQSCKFLPQKKTEELIKKLEGLCSQYQAVELQRQVHIANRVKSENKSVLLNVDVLYEAMSLDAMVRFKLRIHTPKKEIIYRKKGLNYLVSPYALIYSDDQYYLLGYDQFSRRFQHYRVDRMEGIFYNEKLKRQGKEAFEKIDMSAYDKYTFSMYGTGMRKLTIVKMRFKNTLTDVVMDKFGYDINTVPDGEEYFTTSVPVVVSQQLYAWVFGLGPDAEIVAPPAAVHGMKIAIDKIAEKYNAGANTVVEARKAGGRKAYRKKYGSLPLVNLRNEEECKTKGM